MFKLILISLLSISLNAVDTNFPINECEQYKREANKYVEKVEKAKDETVAHRYLVIADRYMEKFDNCVQMEIKGIKYQGYRKNPIQESK